MTPSFSSQINAPAPLDMLFPQTPPKHPLLSKCAIELIDMVTDKVLDVFPHPHPKINLNIIVTKQFSE
jgi:hypothetical protein